MLHSLAVEVDAWMDVSSLLCTPAFSSNHLKDAKLVWILSVLYPSVLKNRKMVKKRSIHLRRIINELVDLIVAGLHGMMVLCMIERTYLNRVRAFSGLLNVKIGYNIAEKISFQ